ncbi:hypothetical protein GYMLUDRAFT_923965 [Collybiopsis luxurians FD-317 M1]|uniref:Unplaced genomic scaffold GYMLUscaffold_75, whole genome shotgun sequence n=1 Tax=Collybiopsis luxurians FD-317 M1 TaxID=944289 RepID=A0A0D0CFX6_9AGAR|nr:hypothetical protein GYMLUDRAFT_923965 [Collybiopsis luxurians FD-317 M1]
MSSICQTDCAGSAILSTLTFGASMDDTLGAAFIGYSFCCTIFGILTAQVSNYYEQYAVDPLALKIVVGLVWTLETLQVALISHGVYHYTVTLFGSYISILKEHILWSLVTSGFVAAISGSIVKTYFIIRVWRSMYLI